MVLCWYLVPLAAVLGGLWVVVSSHKHLLVVLLGLEHLVVGAFCLIIFLLVSFSVESYVSVIFLTFAVCEGGLGLAVLVSLSRSCGNDYFGAFSVLQC